MLSVLNKALLPLIMNPYRKYRSTEQNAEILERFYTKDVTGDILHELEILLSPLTDSLDIGMGQFASCSVWRSERILHNYNDETQGRFAVRLHLFESHIDDIGESKKKGKLVGRYLGYISLRPKEYESPSNQSKRFFYQYTSLATIAPPPHMLHARYHIITCISGQADGVLPFRATPFCQPDDGKGLALCAHVALHAALLLKSNIFGFRPISSQDMIALFWRSIDSALPASERKKKVEQLRSVGISMKEALKILCAPETGAGGIIEIITKRLGKPLNKKEVYLDAHICLTDYIANGIPVVMEVNPQDSAITTRHAILIIGFHLMTNPDEQNWHLPDAEDDPSASRIDIVELPGRFIIHDIHQGPYRECDTDYLLSRAWLDGVGDEESGIRFMPILPRGAKIGIQDVCDHTRRMVSSRDWSDYLRGEFPKCKESKIDEFKMLLRSGTFPCRLSTRLLTINQIYKRYLPSKKTKKEADDSNSIIKSNLKNLLMLDKFGDCNGENKYYWCVESHISHVMQENQEDIQNMKQKKPMIVMFFPIELDRQKMKNIPYLRYLDDKQVALSDIFTYNWSKNDE
jgi:hypothetical protein